MSEEKSATAQFPTVEDFCLNVPLYKPHNKTHEFNSEQAYDDHIQRCYQNFLGKLDCVCVECKRESVFLHANSLPDTFTKSF